MTEKRFAFDVGERVIDTARDFTKGTVVKQLKLDDYHHDYNPRFNMYEVHWDGREAGFFHQAREEELRTACLPVIGAVVAMVAASHVALGRQRADSLTCYNSPYGEASPHRCIYCDDEVLP